MPEINEDADRHPSDLDKVEKPDHRGGTDVFESPEGRGARFDRDGAFQTFLEPARK
ncbi:hypothetical protein JCM19000A_42870 [Silvimonas sp. JCM 19000]